MNTRTMRLVLSVMLSIASLAIGVVLSAETTSTCRGDECIAVPHATVQALSQPSLPFRPPVPGTALRAWVGKPEAAGFYSVSYDYLFVLSSVVGLDTSSRLLEPGSGCGRIARLIAPLLDGEVGGIYRGFDIHRGAVQYATDSVTYQYEHAQFEYVDVFNTHYNRKGSIKPADFRFPYDDETFTVVHLPSVFTHMVEEEIEQYMAEIYRVLRPDGVALISMFVLNEESLGGLERRTAMFKFKPYTENSMAASSRDPGSAISFQMDWARELVARHGMNLLTISYGHWSEKKKRPHAFLQDWLLVWKPKICDEGTVGDLACVPASHAVCSTDDLGAEVCGAHLAYHTRSKSLTERELRLSERMITFLKHRGHVPPSKWASEHGKQQMNHMLHDLMHVSRWRSMHHMMNLVGPSPYLEHALGVMLDSNNGGQYHEIVRSATPPEVCQVSEFSHVHYHCVNDDTVLPIPNHSFHTVFGVLGTSGVSPEELSHYIKESARAVRTDGTIALWMMVMDAPARVAIGREIAAFTFERYADPSLVHYSTSAQETALSVTWLEEQANAEGLAMEVHHGRWRWASLKLESDVSFLDVVVLRHA